MIDEVLRALEAVKKAGDGWVARCPAHEDATASLSVKDKGGADGWPLLHCFTGCRFEDIREALEAKGIKRDEPDRTPPPPARSLKRREPYDIQGPDGTLLCRHVRLEWDDGGKSFSWEMPDGRRTLDGLAAADLLFGVEQLAGLEQKRVAVVTEGEKAAAALRAWGVKGAVGTVCGASATPSAKALESLRGRAVYLWPDNDRAGEIHMSKTAKALDGIAEKVRVIEWADAPEKGDAADWIETPRNRFDFAELLAKAVDPAPPGWPEAVTPIHDAELVKLTLRDMEDFSRDDRQGVVRTGFPKLDRAIRGGFEPGEVYLIGAPTGGGKTTIVQCLAAEAAKAGPVLLVTPEMTLESMARRELLRRSATRERELSKWAKPEERADAWSDLSKAAGLVLEEKPPILLLDKADASMDDVEAVAEAIDGLRLVLIDYAQQVADMDSRTPRYLQVGDVASRAVDLAKRLRIPFVLASQVNVVEPKRKGGSRGYSFRESQVLEQKSAVVLVFDLTRQADADDPDDDELDAEFRCRKNRHGPMFRPIGVTWRKALFQIEPPSELPAPTKPAPEDVRTPYSEKADD